MHKSEKRAYLFLQGDLLIPFKEVDNFRDGHVVQSGLEREENLIGGNW